LLTKTLLKASKAAFEYKPLSTVGIIVFNASKSFDEDGNIILYIWNFGDDNVTITNQSIITHTYLDMDNYTVTLTVIDNDGLTNSTSKIVWVHQTNKTRNKTSVATSTPTVPPNQLPIANFTYTISDLTVTFNANNSYDPDDYIVSYEWDFGDGYVDYGRTVTHTYSSAGTYTVTLTVTDDDGATSTKVVQILVSHSQPSPRSLLILHEDFNVSEEKTLASVHRKVHSC